MFRKMRHSELPEADCHYFLRNDILRSTRTQPDPVAFSVAWDWQFTGFTQKYIQEYNEMVRLKKVRARSEKRKILAVHESTVIRCAQTIMGQYKQTNSISDLNRKILHGIATTLTNLVEMEKHHHDKFVFDPDIEYYRHSLTSAFSTCITCKCELANHYVWRREDEKQCCVKCYDETKKKHGIGSDSDDCPYLLCYNVMSLDDEFELLQNVKMFLES